MNSKLLEEAIVDAEALREAALKNAQQAILEKYEPEIKTALQSLLEQEGDEAGLALGDLDLDSADSAPAQEMDVPLAATDGEELCPCPDDDEVITISIGDLEKAIANIARSNAEASSAEMPMPEMPEPDNEPGEQAEVGDEMAGLEPEEEPLMEEVELGEDLLASILEENDELTEVYEEDDDKQLQEIRDSFVRNAFEAIQQDPSLVKTASKYVLSEIYFHLKKLMRNGEDVDQELFSMVSDALEAKQQEEREAEEFHKKYSYSGMGPDPVHSAEYVRKMSRMDEGAKQKSKLLAETKLLTEKFTKVLEQNKNLLEENKKIKETALKLSQHLEKTNLLNAKLFYKNQALGNHSLNERQKEKIVEAVSKADSVDEVKMIYETLSNAVGTVNSGPQSLSEAVEKKGGLVFKPRQNQNSQNSSPLVNRWQKMAGIKKDN